MYHTVPICSLKIPHLHAVANLARGVLQLSGCERQIVQVSNGGLVRRSARAGYAEKRGPDPWLWGIQVLRSVVCKMQIKNSSYLSSPGQPCLCS